MPHVTIKGFFRSDAKIAEIVQAVDGALTHRPSFTVVNNGPVPFGRGGVALDVQHGERGDAVAARGGVFQHRVAGP